MMMMMMMMNGTRAGWSIASRTRFYMKLAVRLLLVCFLRAGRKANTPRVL